MGGASRDDRKKKDQKPGNSVRIKAADEVPVGVSDALPVLDIVGPEHMPETSASPPGGQLQLTD